MADDVLVILQQAVAKEEQRAKFYTEVAQRTCNPLAQATFNILASEEAKHKEYIHRFYSGMMEKKHWPDMSECATELPGRWPQRRARSGRRSARATWRKWSRE